MDETTLEQKAVEIITNLEKLAEPAMQNAALRVQITVEPDAAYAALAALAMDLKSYEEALQKSIDADGRAYWLDTIAKTRLHLNQLDRALRTARVAS